jgi:stress response protein SCP2
LSSGDLSKIETGAKPPTEWGDRGDKVEAVDVVAFVVDADEQVGEDSGFCFYNNLTHPIGAVDLALETPGEALLQARLNLLPEGRARIVVAAALEGDATFGDLGPIELVLRTTVGTPSCEQPWTPRPTRPPWSWPRSTTATVPGGCALSGKDTNPDSPRSPCCTG